MTKILDLIGRIFISGIFLLSAYNKIVNYEGTIGWMASFGLPGFLLAPAISRELCRVFLGGSGSGIGRCVNPNSASDHSGCDHSERGACEGDAAGGGMQGILGMWTQNVPIGLIAHFQKSQKH